MKILNSKVESTPVHTESVEVISEQSTKEVSQELNPEIISNLILHNDLAKMTNAQKVEYCLSLCKALGLSPTGKPFQIIKFNNKETLYATKDCTEQLRLIHKVSVVEATQNIVDGLCISKCKVQNGVGRYDVATGVTSLTRIVSTVKNGVPVKIEEPLSPDEKANAIMKSETKAKRRATLSICGLGILDESELDTIGKYETKDISVLTAEKPAKDITVADIVPDLTYEEIMHKVEDCLYEEELKSIWESYPQMHKNKAFKEAVTANKARILNSREFYDDTTIEYMLRCDKKEDLPELDKQIQAILQSESFKQYDEKYKTAFLSTFSIITRKLNSIPNKSVQLKPKGE